VSVERATIVAGATPSCRICRRSRASGDVLYCGELRSNAVGGVIVLDVAAAKRAGTFGRECEQVAHRCKYYQEGE
jgi:hypothetical protein